MHLLCITCITYTKLLVQNTMCLTDRQEREGQEGGHGHTLDAHAYKNTTKSDRWNIGGPQIRVILEPNRWLQDEELSSEPPSKGAVHHCKRRPLMTAEFTLPTTYMWETVWDWWAVKTTVRQPVWKSPCAELINSYFRIITMMFRFLKEVGYKYRTSLWEY